MFTTTIDSILKDFTVKIAQLNTIVGTKQAQAEVERQRALAAQSKAVALNAEAARAAAIASRIEALVG